MFLIPPIRSCNVPEDLPDMLMAESTKLTSSHGPSTFVSTGVNVEVFPPVFVIMPASKAAFSEVFTVRTGNVAGLEPKNPKPGDGDVGFGTRGYPRTTLEFLRTSATPPLKRIRLLPFCQKIGAQSVRFWRYNITKPVTHRICLGI